MKEEKRAGTGGGGFLMRAAYFVHGAIAPCVPEAMRLSPESKQAIRRLIVRVDDAMVEGSSRMISMDMFIPGTEELISRNSHTD